MSDQQRPANNDETQMMSATREMPAAHATPNGGARRRRVQRSGSFVPPLWSLALMLVTVAAVSGGVVLAVYLLGGNMPPQEDAIVIVVTSAPTQPQAIPPSAFPSQTPAFTGGVSIPVPTFAQEGPTQPPVVLTPTPDVISIGRTVQVINVGENGLNVRSAPGLDNVIEFTADENSFLEIIGGPDTAQNDGFTWWQVRDPFAQQQGWAVDLYMDVQPENPTP